jgi:hypothetical protein
MVPHDQPEAALVHIDIYKYDLYLVLILGCFPAGLDDDGL